MSLIQRAVSRLVPNRAKLPESNVLAEVAMENNVIQGNNNTVTIINHSSMSVIADSQKADTEVFPLSKVYITAQIPPEIAILYIQADGKERYRLMGGNAKTTLKLTESYEKPDISLDLLVQKEQTPQTIRHTIKCFSRHNLVLRKWLNKIIQNSDCKKYLVIADHTNFEIPWELLQPRPESFPYEYLGALVTTVRWQNIDSDDEITLEFDPEECCGDTIAYTNHQELNVSEEIMVLKKLNANIFDDIAKFHGHLQIKNTDSSFIYIAAHGIFSKDHHDIAIGVLNNKEQQLKLIDLDMNPLKTGGIVFLNTCHSGQHQTHSRIPNCRVGFVELFFRKGAKGVIGTLGGVGDIYAARIARDLMQTCLDAPSLSVAALLRDIRAKVVADLAKEQTQDNLLAFIYTFMYVYYGNPMTVLRLKPSGGQIND
jgi:hypothetical protein